MKRTTNTKYTKRNFKKAKKPASKVINQGLIVLWCCTFFLLAFMILRWNGDVEFISNPAEQTQSIFVDDVLLSSSDLKLRSTSSLINISLNAEPASSTVKKNDQKQTKPVSRDELYKNILNQKIKKAENKPSQGFAIKPLPE